MRNNKSFEELRAIALKAVETRKANLAAKSASNGENYFVEAAKQKVAAAANKPAGWWQRKQNRQKRDNSVVLDEALAALEANPSKSDKAANLAYQRLAELAEGTLVTYYDEGYRYAKLVKVTPTMTTLASIGPYKKTSRNFRVKTTQVAPIQENR